MDLGYLTQIAQAADNLGYYGVLLPTGKSCEDAWAVAAAMVPLIRNLRYLVAVRPGLQPPSLAARMTSTLDRLSDDGRVLINVVMPPAHRTRSNQRERCRLSTHSSSLRGGVLSIG